MPFHDERTFQLRACTPEVWKKERGRRNQLYKCLRVYDTTLVGERTATMSHYTKVRFRHSRISSTSAKIYYTLGLGIWIFVSAILRWIRVSIREEFRMDRSANSNLNFKYYSPSFLEGYDSYRFEYNSKVSISLCRKISSWIVSGVFESGSWKTRREGKEYRFEFDDTN